MTAKGVDFALPGQGADPPVPVLCYWYGQAADVPTADSVARRLADVYAKVGNPAVLHRVSCVVVWDDDHPDKPADLTPATPSRFYQADRKVQMLASWCNGGTMAHELGHALSWLQRIWGQFDSLGNAIRAAGMWAWGWQSEEDFAESFRNWAGPPEAGRVIQPGQPEYFRLVAALPGR